MKKLIFLFTVLLALMMLYSCSGGEQGTNDPVDPPESEEPEELLFSAIIKVDEDCDISSISDAYYAAKGRMITVMNGSTEVGEREIIVGETARRPASVAAVAELQRDMEASSHSDAEGYIIYAKDGSVAVYWSHDYFEEQAIEALIASVINSSIKKLDNGVIFKFCDSLSEVREAARWADIENEASEDIVNALKSLYDFIFGTDSSRIYMWMANLYDPTTGAFYYANSARDYEGFLPDLESTAQLLGFLGGMGMFNEYGGWKNAFTSEMKSKLGDWIISLQNSNGYFYHPQWGTLAGQSRLGRDLMWATDLLGALGRTPKYKTPYQSGASGSAVTLPLSMNDKSIAVSAVVEAASDDYLASAEAFSAYLESQRPDLMSGKLTSHSFGHSLNSVQNIIFSRGYGDILFDFFDGVQEEVYQRQVASGINPNGLWEDGITYTSMSGLFKIADMYGTRREIKYRDLIVNSAIQANLISADNPDMKASAIILIFNPWSGLSRVINNTKKFGTEDELTGMYERIRENAADMINITKDKLVPFMHDDGSLSYNDTGLSAPITQGVEVSLGLNEGDVNATILGINGVITNIFNAIGYEKVQVWDSEDAKVFIDTISNLPPITEKLPRPVLNPVDFENGQMTNINTSALDASGSYAVIADDPYRADNSVLSLTYVTYDRLKILEMTPRGKQDQDLKVFEIEMCIAPETTGAYKIMIDSLYLVELIKMDNGYILRQNVTTGSESNAAEHQIVGTDENGETLYLSAEKWFKIRIECITVGETPSFKVFVDTNLEDDKDATVPAIVGTSYFGIHKGTDMNDRFTYMKIMANSKSEGTFYIDNVYITTEKLEVVTE